jgi:HEAT repeat protein
VELLLVLGRDGTVEARVRERAAEALGKMGRADEAVDAWLALARDPAVEARTWERAAEAWLDFARDPAVGNWGRVRAAKALGKLGRATPEVLAGLRALAEELGTPKRVRRVAKEALGRLEG